MTPVRFLVLAMLASPVSAQVTFTLVAPGCAAIGAPSVNLGGQLPPGLYWHQGDPFLDYLAYPGNPGRSRLLVLSLTPSVPPIPLPFTWWNCQLHVTPDIVIFNLGYNQPFLPLLTGLSFYVQGIESWDGTGPGAEMFPSYVSATQAWRVDT